MKFVHKHRYHNTVQAIEFFILGKSCFVYVRVYTGVMRLWKSEIRLSLYLSKDILVADVPSPQVTIQIYNIME